ncbi:yggS [Lepeophtheirus salmonis]|uniref:Pyridoxal phosphate homeostasis protein n=1 Tax=Lepeophtheirus salmonis TaxID=72036 RepID=A0A7R8CHW4_LEPSM|nr:yggS [Lepeophtheirus salmonis]CAF2790186.1 yggS [Lepeophtheirus salmonis]
MTSLAEPQQHASPSTLEINTLQDSQTKPKESIIDAYKAGQRVFGENYIQELLDKSLDPELQRECPDISWHFIGNIQSKNVSKLLKVSHLSVIHTIGSLKIAEKIQNACLSRSLSFDVLVQVNTSGEEAKGGVRPGEETSGLVGYILNECHNLRFVGLMTIGAYDSSLEAGVDNPDFIELRKSRVSVASTFNLTENDLRLSMGMSSDLENAICLGSTDVRVGRQIFGAREYAKKD